MNKKIKYFVITFSIWNFLLILFIIFGLYDPFNLEEGITLIPGNKDIDTIYLILILPLLSIFIILILSNYVSMLLIKLHKILKLNKYDYKILNKLENKSSKLLIGSRVLILGLFSFSAAATLITLVGDSDILLPTIHEPGPFVVSLFIGITIMPILLLIVEPFWLLQDSAVVTIRVNFKEGRRQLPDIEGVYHTYLNYISGFVGISTVINMVLLMIQEMAITPESTILILIAPIFFITMAYPVVILHEIFLGKTKTRLINKLKKKGILTIDTIKLV